MPKSQKTYDFAPLTQPVSFRKAVHASDFLHSYTQKIVFAIGFSIVIFYIAISGEPQWWFSALLIIGAIGAVVVFMAHSARHRLRMRAFAQANSLEYLETFGTGGNTGMIFQQGHSKLIQGAFVSSETSWSEIGNFEYVTGSGRSSRTHRFGYIRIKLPRRLPHMVLDSKANNHLGNLFSNLPESFNKNQKLSLEGDFDKYFTLYAPATYKRDALYIFTPDVMQAVIDDSSEFDMEVVGDDLYLYSSGRLSLEKSDTLKRLFQMADTISGKIDHQADYYSDERVGNRAANTIGIGGRTLRTRISTTTFIIVVIVVVIILYGQLAHLLHW